MFYLNLLSIPLVFVFLAFPLVFADQRNFINPNMSVEVDRIYLILGYCFLIFIFIHNCIKYNYDIFRITKFSYLLFLLFSILTMFSSVINANINSAVFAVFFLVIINCIKWRKNEDFLSYDLVISSVVICGFLLFALFYLGFPSGRWLGGIHPNIIGGFTFSAVFLSLFMRGVWPYFVFLISMYFSLLISSRFSILSIMVVCTVFLFLNRSNTPLFVKVILLLFAILGALSFFIAENGGVVADIFELNDRYRGLGSGGTGRTEHWVDFIPQLAERPLLGFGFRNRAAYLGAHNGFMNIILENGLLGGALFISGFLVRGIELMSSYLKASSSVRYEYSVIISGYFGIVVGTVFQPQLLNFGDGFGLVGLLILFMNPIGNSQKLEYD